VRARDGLRVGDIATELGINSPTRAGISRGQRQLDLSRRWIDERTRCASCVCCHPYPRNDPSTAIRSTSGSRLMGELKTLRPSVPTLGVSARTGWAAPSRGTPAQRRYGTEWRRIRQRVLERDCYCCKTCEGNVRAGNIVDHIIENKRTAALGTTSRTWKSSAMSITRSRHRLSRTNGGREPRGGGSHISQPIRYRMRSNSRGIHGV